MQSKYDIFISYRREGGAQYARILQLMLSQRGYKVFLDYDELTDGRFGNHIKEAIESSSIFMIILSKQSLQRCKNEDDWVRCEILYAIKLGKSIIPVNPDSSFDVIPNNIPSEIINEIKGSQYSEVSFGQLLGVTVDFMIEKRITPRIGTRLRLDSDLSYLKQQLQNEDKSKKRHRIFIKIAVILCLLFTMGIVTTTTHMYINEKAINNEKELLIKQIESRHAGLDFSHDNSISIDQLMVINEILESMRPIQGDTLMMSAFETTEKQYYVVLGDKYNTTQENIPITNISFGRCIIFIAKLNQLINSDRTNIEFSLPTEEEWEYAAFGGDKNKDLIYAGSNDPDSVAWYMENSSGVLHPADGQNKLFSNALGLFDMSGNASEYVFTPYVDSEDSLITGYSMVVKGGNYSSSKRDLMIKNRSCMDVDMSSPKVGFRLVLRKKQ